MSPFREQIGRLFTVGIPSGTLDAQTCRRLEALHVGGVILFRRNVGTPDEIAALTRALHRLPSQPLVAIDHEGGRVQRLGEPFTRFPPAAAVGRRHDPDLAFEIGRAMAEELAGVGIDINFAPVLDVHSNPLNPVIGDRAFGTEPAPVAAMGIALMRGLLAGGVIPCGKHFPGHGDTLADSHLELPVVRRSRAQLAEVELAPFREAIAAGIPMLMTAHVLYPALDPTCAATLSSRILSDLLRGELGFAGVIVSDDLEMRAIADHSDVGAAAVATLHAGADMLLVCEHLEKAEAAVQAVERAVTEGLIAADRISAAANRITRLRRSRPQAMPSAVELPNRRHQLLVDGLA